MKPVFLLLLPSIVAAQVPDRPFANTSREAVDSMTAAIAPAIAEALKTYPQARRRFLSGLPPRHSFSVTTRLHDDAGRMEQVFVTVDSIRDSTVFGRIASEIGLVAGYRWGQSYALPERDVLDWTILLPDGQEEGNFVGKFLDRYYEQQRAESVGDVPFRISSLDSRFAIVGEFEGVAGVRRDTIDVVIRRATILPTRELAPTDTITDVRLSAGIALVTDEQGNWVVADSSEWLPVTRRLARDGKQELGPLRLRVPRPTHAPLASFWLVFALEGRAPRSFSRPGALFGTFAHGPPDMFAGFK